MNLLILEKKMMTLLKSKKLWADLFILVLFIAVIQIVILITF